MNEQLSSTKPIAVLIDAENAQLSVLPDVLANCEKLGRVAVKRAYGDFTLANLKDWPKVATELSIHPMQQFRIINGKSVSDSALIIDAMDLLHSERYSAFCIVSSDSDFTRLATRMREDGLLVYGFGERKTSDGFVAACNKFYDTKKLSEQAGSKVAKKTPASSRIEPSKEVLDHLAQVIEAAGGKKQEVLLTVLGQRLRKEFSDFSWKHYRCAGLGKFLSSFPEKFEVSTTAGKSFVKLP